METPPAALELDGNRLSIAWGDFAALVNIDACCRLTDGNVLRSDAWTQDADGVVRTACGPLELVLETRAQGELLRVVLIASASTACEVAELGLETSPMAGGSKPAWLLYSGYQSWDRAGLVGWDSGTAHESWWLAAVTDPEGRGIQAAAATCEASGTRFVAREGRLSMLWCQPPHPVLSHALWEAEPEEAWRSEELALRAGVDVAQLEAPRPHRTESVALEDREPPKGWLSWYHYGPWVSREDVVENATSLAEGRLKGLGYEVVQIDDGWQQAYGDWVPNSRFAPLEPLLERMRAAKQTPGIWTAPFLVGVDSQLAREAPDSWFVHTSEGRRLIDPRPGLPGEMHVLDPRQPDVCEHLRAVFRHLAQLGLGYFKIDYLYAGSYGGVEPFRAAIRAIREAIGDAYLLACGSPLLPVVGLVDGCRIWEDTARPIYNFETGAPQPTVFGDEVQWAARNLAARVALRAWFHLDADIALVGGNLPIAQARQLVSLVAMSGGPFFASDDIAKLAPERCELLHNEQVLALVGRGTAIPDWEPLPREIPPAIWRLGDDVVALFNWFPEERRLHVPKPGRWTYRDLWGEYPTATFEDALTLVLPPDGVGLLALDRA